MWLQAAWWWLVDSDRLARVHCFLDYTSCVWCDFMEYNTTKIVITHVLIYSASYLTKNGKNAMFCCKFILKDWLNYLTSYEFNKIVK